MMLDYITSDEINDHIHVMGSNLMDATASQFTVGYINRREHTLLVRSMAASDNTMTIPQRTTILLWSLDL